jgi:nicotinate-nucleotide pyrophosphorylase (carboxylating)
MAERLESPVEALSPGDSRTRAGWWQKVAAGRGDGHKMASMPDSSSLRLRPTPPTPALAQEIITRALLEDLAGGDITTDATVAPELLGMGVATSKSPLCACGSTVAQAVFAAVDPQLSFEVLVPDGTWVPGDRALWHVRGSARSILMAERTALNFVQHMSGIATLTHRFVREIPVGASARIVDTRKTTPGLRLLERYAVRAGGAHNHRDDVGSAVLIKDNHIVAAGGIAAAVARARNRVPHTSKIEIEVANLNELEQALAAKVDIVMLDNFELTLIRKAVSLIAGRALVEVSGNVTLEGVAELARAGADIISVGALTHSAPAADVSLDIRVPMPERPLAA